MGRIPKFIYAERNIKAFFASRKQRVYTEQELAGILEDNRDKWDLSLGTNTSKFLARLLDQNILTEALMQQPKKQSYQDLSENRLTGAGGIKRYLWETPTIYEIALTLKSKSYLSHYTAVYLNNLTSQIPKTIYLTHEQSPKNVKPGKLTQEGIDHAFAQPQRTSDNHLVYEDYTIILLNGKYTNRQGVYTTLQTEYPITLTNIERTLLDITVRPNYAGGPFAVLETYKNAVTQISTGKFLSLIKGIQFIYPYHQAIGFYLETAGYKGKLLDELRNMSTPYKFYLAYEMKEKEYSKEWKIYYPKGM